MVVGDFRGCQKVRGPPPPAVIASTVEPITRDGSEPELGLIGGSTDKGGEVGERQHDVVPREVGEQRETRWLAVKSGCQVLDVAPPDPGREIGR